MIKSSIDKKIENPNLHQLEEWYHSFQPKIVLDIRNIISVKSLGISMIYHAFIHHLGQILEIRLDNSKEGSIVFCSPRGWGYLSNPLNSDINPSISNKFRIDKAIINLFKSMAGLDMNTKI